MGKLVNRHCLPVLLAVVGLFVAVALVFWPVLPAGPDIYVHLLWTQQVMRCFSQGSLPLWLPDLNAGFGSPGIRLYSPAGPVLAGFLAWLLGDAGRGLRLAALLLLAAFLWQAKKSFPQPLVLGLFVASPIVPFLLFYRAAFSEFYALPIAFWLLQASLQKPRSVLATALAWALLWLVHAPTFLMVSALTLAAAGLGSKPWEGLKKWASSWILGFCLVAWHWLPLIQEQQWVAAKEGLTAGIFDFRRNFLGFAQAHDPQAVSALSLLALCWSVLLLFLRPSWDLRKSLTLLCLFLASPLAYPLWRVLLPLAWLQFPWRFLTPASLLLPGALTPLSRRRKLLSAALFLLPYLWMPAWPIASDPHLVSSDSWVSLGAKMHQAFSANPLIVDAPQNRPASFALLAQNLSTLGQRQFLCQGTCRLVSWQPLRRALEVEGPEDWVYVRLLAYPLWAIALDGRPVAPSWQRGILAVWVPAGRHRLEVFWQGNPLTPWGWGLALLALALVGLLHRRAKP